MPKQPQTVELQEIDGALTLDFNELANELGWQPGDELDMQIQGDCIVVKNLTQNPQLF